ncbi:phage morphogenesis protein [Mergibacter septicus]|uniref:DNA circularization protein n=1 Tax=Mergibacter septicus TaxID=221402 RepID=UPI001178D598|nr:DNA circularization N-terminal domain-containing protein [Mergibacter septicus]AWX14276.1 phage morphogenesis protein [Mergibacter septicus]
MGWTMPIQRASYRGVHFDVLSIDDSLERAVVEHSYPYINGADIEDMGLSPLAIKIKAIFYGPGYYTDFKKFLNVLQKPGSDTLMHPIRGRLQNMICTSASFSHEAENIDYVALDLTFKEATTLSMLFSEDTGLLSKIDSLLSELEDFIDDAVALFATAMEYVSFLQNAKSRLLGTFGGLLGCFEQVANLFNFEKNLSSVFTVSSFVDETTAIAKKLIANIDTGINENLTISRLKNKDVFNAGLVQLNDLNKVADNIVKFGFSAKLQINENDILPTKALIKLSGAISISKLATAVIDEYQDNLSSTDIEVIYQSVQQEILGALNIIRQLLQKYLDNQSISDNQAILSNIYTSTQKNSENLRQISADFTKLAQAVINTKPPLLVRPAPITGTLQQIAHEMYQDFTRATELLNLNPQIINPNFINKGDLLNGYAK